MLDPEVIIRANKRLGIAIYRQRQRTLVIRCNRCHLGFIVSKSSWAARRAIRHARRAH